MIALLAKIFCKEEGKTPAQQRRAYGVLCALVGLALNLLLFGFKLLAARLSASISIKADAFNNLSDALSSVVTLLGFRLALKRPDRDHPFGHGRAEYLSGLAVSVLILLMGAEVAKTSVERIFHPAAVEGGTLTVVILAVSILVKLYMAYYNRAVGKRLNAPAMRAAATDSLSDALATSVVLLAAITAHTATFPLDGYAGVLLALFILREGVCTAKGMIDPLLGVAPPKDFVARVEALVLSYDGILGVHDLLVHDYGPAQTMISLHAEVPAEKTVAQVHEVIDRIEQDLERTLGCSAVIHADPVASDGGETERVRAQVEDALRALDPAVTVHDFRLVRCAERTDLVFDAVLPFAFPLSDEEAAERIRAIVRELSVDYDARVKVERPHT